MGIKYLNSFLKTNCPESIKCINISEISGKKIAVDISIYMYKFISEDNLIENIYLMLSIFRYYNVIPIFVFDGKPPTEKKELLQKRKEDKIEAEKEYKRLKMRLESNNVEDNEDMIEIISNMDILKKKFIYVSNDQINQVKTLIRSLGCTYYDAPGEADELCAMLVMKQKVWACLSEDMDMFVYGCTRVLRYFSLLNHTMVLYNLKDILVELGISQKEFREICVISGTDYNMNINALSGQIPGPNLHDTLKLFKKYHKKKDKSGQLTTDFYKWLITHSKYIHDYDLLQKTYNIFDLSSISNNSYFNLKNFEKIKIVNGQVMKNIMQPILEDDGFIFAK